MTDSVDKKSKEKTNLEVDLDAMLDDAESSLGSLNEFQDDEDAIDRLLMDVGFDSDDELMQPETSAASAVNDADTHDELDDLLGFDGFGDGFATPEKTPEAGESEQVVEDFSLALPDQQQDDEDAIDRLLMDASVGADEPMPAAENIDALEVLDEFSDFTDFSEPDMEPVLETDEPEAVAAEIEEPGADDVDTADEGLDDFSDFSDFNEPDMISLEIDEPEQEVASPSAPVAIDLPDEIDDFSGLGDTDAFAETGIIQDSGIEDEIEAPAESEPDLIAIDTQAQPAIDDALVDLQSDEDGIGDMFMDSGSESDSGPDPDVQLELADDEEVLFGDDVDLGEIADLFQLSEASEGVSREIEEDQLAETDQSPQDEGDFLLPDFDITADMEMSGMEDNAEDKGNGLADAFADAAFLNEDNEAVQALAPESTEPKPANNEAVSEAQPKQAASAAVENMGNAMLNPLAADQEDMKKQLDEAENKIKKAKRFSYAALGFGVIALSAAAGLGVITYSAKSEVAKLTEQVSSLEASLAKNVENNPTEEINALMSSVVQLNQQVYGFITQLKEAPQFPVDLLNNKVSDIVAKQDLVSKALDMLQVKIGGEEGKIAFKPLVTEPAKVQAVHEPAPAKEEQERDIASAKAEAVHGPAPGKAETAKEGDVKGHDAAKQPAVHDVIAPVKDPAKPEAMPAKVESAPESMPAKAKAQPEAVAAKAKSQSELVSAKPTTPPKAVVKEEPVKASQPAAINGKWGVNLVAFKQEWFAKSKAAEFARLGIFAEVIPVHEGASTLYRLRVGGFKSKAEAYSNADSIKKALNLDSVWVSDN